MNKYELAGLSVRDGIKIRKLKWMEGVYVYFDRFSKNWRDESGYEFSPDFNDLDSWGLYIEPKKEVDLITWYAPALIRKFGSARANHASVSFTSKEEASTYYKSMGYCSFGWREFQTPANSEDWT